MVLNNSMLKTILKKCIGEEMRKNIWKFILHFSIIKAEKIKPSEKTKLIRFYKEDVLKLSELINRDLKLWLR